MQCSSRVQLKLGDVEHVLLALNILLGFTVSQFVFVVISNAMLVVGLFKTNRALSFGQRMFVALSVVDVLASSSNLARFAMDLLGVRCRIIHIVKNCTSVMVSLGVFIFCVLCGVRYWSIKKPLRRTPSRVVSMVLVLGTTCNLVILAFLVCFIIMEEKGGKRVVVGVMRGIATLLMVCMISVNVLSYRLLKDRRDSGYPQPNNKTSADTQKNAPQVVQTPQTRRQARKSVTTLVVLTALYLLCILPRLVFDVIERRLSAYPVLHFVLHDALILFWLTNTGLNSLVYMLRTKKLRRTTHACYAAEGIMKQLPPGFHLFEL